MNKSILVDNIAAQFDLSKAKSSEIVDFVFEQIMAATQSGSGASFVGFGSFSLSARAAREGRNPQTGEAIKIAASKVPKFKPGSKFKEAVNTKSKSKKK